MRNDDFGSSLTVSDYATLDRCFISREIADSARLRRATSDEGKQIVGRRDHDDYSGIIFPYVWPGDLGVRSHCLRRDNPPFELKDGAQKERHKYLLPPGQTNLLYFHPLTAVDDLENSAVPIVILEGQKKTLAMFRLAWEACGEGSEHARFVPVGLNGVYGWTGTVGKTSNAKGERVSQKGVIPDLLKIVWQKRPVYILFDANVGTNHRVASARNLLAQELASRGAQVWFIGLPQEEGVNGIDDYLGRHGVEAGIKLFDLARQFDPKEKLATLHYTDYGNEQAFEILQGNEYLFNWTSREWLHWNGIYWEIDATFTVDRAMLDVAAARLQAMPRLSRPDLAERPSCADDRATHAPQSR